MIIIIAKILIFKQRLVHLSNKIKEKLFEKYYFDDWVTESSDQRINLKDAIDLILDFNENEYENKDEDDYCENENEDDDKTIDQNEIKKLNDYFNKIIDKSKSFEDQIKSLKKKRIFKKILSSQRL